MSNSRAASRALAFAPWGHHVKRPCERRFVHRELFIMPLCAKWMVVMRYPFSVPNYLRVNISQGRDAIYASDVLRFASLVWRCKIREIVRREGSGSMACSFKTCQMVAALVLPEPCGPHTWHRWTMASSMRSGV